MTMRLPVQTAEWPVRPVGASVVPTGDQVFDPGSNRPPVPRLLFAASVPPHTIMTPPAATAVWSSRAAGKPCPGAIQSSSPHDHPAAQPHGGVYEPALRSGQRARGRPGIGLRIVPGPRGDATRSVVASPDDHRGARPDGGVVRARGRSL